MKPRKDQEESDSDHEVIQQQENILTPTPMPLFDRGRTDIYSRIQKSLINYVVYSGYPLCEFLTPEDIGNFIEKYYQ